MRTAPAPRDITDEELAAEHADLMATLERWDEERPARRRPLFGPDEPHDEDPAPGDAGDRAAEVEYRRYY
jgi:hypothetical protein